MRISFQPKIFVMAMMLLLQACDGSDQTDTTANSGYSPEESDPIYAEHVRSTPFQTPEEEQADFILPPGFEVTLFASEPDITKPINMAFDDRGRLWVTQSSEYPIKAGPGEGLDRISILEDTDRDGKADKITHFANNLNIPIGIVPVNDGVIAYSIPNLYRFYDTDNDGREDRREVLLGPFEHKDTHGMVNNLFRGFDGWVHASHGFSNVSIVSGTDGDSIKMVSGNTFRVRMDGSRVEKTTDGRINPFGSDYDDWGYHYSADCHTLPIYQLIWDGNYTQWGKQEPNMGFAPTMMDYSLNSTALSGLVYYTDNQFPEAYQNSFYSGDVVTCRISRSTIEFNGSTPKATRQKDFLVSKDPWFRPVDIKIGPDGAMYVADFYNPIIGHYEVSLDHPKRDRNSGRIWKITYKGNQRDITDWSKANLNDLLKGLNHEVLHERMTATDALVDRFGKKAIDPLLKLAKYENLEPNKLIQVLWGLFRLQSLSDEDLRRGINHPSEKVRVHAFRILANYSWAELQHLGWAMEGLKDPDPHVKRAAVEVLSRHPHERNYRSLVQLHGEVSEHDTHLKYALKLALFHHMQKEPIIEKVVLEQWQEKERNLIAMIVSDTYSPVAGNYLFEYLKQQQPLEDGNLPYLTSIVRTIPEEKLLEVISFAQEKGNAEKSDYRWAMAFHKGMNQRGGSPPKELVDWYEKMARKSLGELPDQADKWTQEEQEKQKFAAEIAGKYRFQSLEKELKNLMQSPLPNEETKATAARSLMVINPAGNIPFLTKMLSDPEQKTSLRQQIALALGISDKTATSLSQQLKGAPMDLQQTIAEVLVNSQEGKNLLLDQIRKGNAQVRVLLGGNLPEKFNATANSQQKQVYEALTANLPPISEERQALIKQRIDAYNADKSILTEGKMLFQQHCSTCHKVGDTGGEIGPQLDGIGNWGLSALAVKVLDPNRNISENFRTYNITLKNGQTLSGLYRREEGQSLILANQSGKEFSVSKEDIADQSATRTTLMPDHFHTILDHDQFNELMAYLLSIK